MLQYNSTVRFDCVRSPYQEVAALNDQHGKGKTTYTQGCGVTDSAGGERDTHTSHARAPIVMALPLPRSRSVRLLPLVTVCVRACACFACAGAAAAALAMAAAREADVLVLGLGITERDRRAGIYQETEGHDRTSIDLPSVQKELARKLIALGWA